MTQDLPPQGGYEPVQYKRNLPFRGVRPSYYLLGMGIICTYGFYEVIRGIKDQRELSREKMWIRIHLTPMLQAEADRDAVRRYLAAQDRERELMKDEKGWSFGSVYNSKRFVRPTFTVTPPAEAIIQEKDYKSANDEAT